MITSKSTTHQLVLQQMGLLQKCQTAGAATIRSLARVHTYVPLEVREPIERLVALQARVRLLSLVPPMDVLLEDVLLGERPLADWAPVQALVVRAHVLLQVRLLCKWLCTLGTDVRALSRVSELVSLKRRLPSEGLVTLLTWVRVLCTYKRMGQVFKKMVMWMYQSSVIIQNGIACMVKCVCVLREYNFCMPNAEWADKKCAFFSSHKADRASMYGLY